MLVASGDQHDVLTRTEIRAGRRPSLYRVAQPQLPRRILPELERERIERGNEAPRRKVVHIRACGAISEGSFLTNANSQGCSRIGLNSRVGLDLIT